MLRKNACPVCGSMDCEELLTLPAIPVMDNILAESSDSAKKAVCGTQSLRICTNCGFVFNSTFEPDKMRYEEGYHAERSGSSYFKQHMEQTASFIEQGLPLQGKCIMEVGCGTGEFLQEVARRGPQSCVGVDPSAVPIERDNLKIQSCTFDADYLEAAAVLPDLLICRHMIEHMEDPLTMLRLFACALPTGGFLYLETPRLDWILENQVFYDFPYEHCAYYSDEFMERLLEAAGFVIVMSTPSYDGEYFSILAQRSKEFSDIEPIRIEQLELVKVAFFQITQVYQRVCQDFCRKSWMGINSHPKTPVYLWGASAKGVMNCNLLPEGSFAGCIDKNPFKQGRFIPGTGHVVLSPAEISYDNVSVILVENDVYMNEIQKEVEQIDPRIQVFSLNQAYGLSCSQTS